MAANTRLRTNLRSLFDSIKTSLSPSRSSRNGATVKAVVIHTTESSDGSDEGVANYFANPKAEVSSHYIVDSEPLASGFTTVTRIVPEDEKAWTSKSANPTTINYELVGYAKRSRAEWLKRMPQLRTTAALVADDVLEYGIPVRRSYPGILGHGDLGKYGFANDHTDPGPNFPWEVFLKLVDEYVADATATKRPTVVSKTPRYSLLDSDGKAILSEQKDLDAVVQRAKLAIKSRKSVVLTKRLV